MKMTLTWLQTRWLFIKPSDFLCNLPIDICGDLWYNNNGVQRAGVGRPGPNFRSVYPICNFSATSSDFSHMPNFPETDTPYDPISPPHVNRFSIITDRYDMNLLFCG